MKVSEVLSLKNRAVREASEELIGPVLDPEGVRTQRMCQTIPGKGAL